jgi:hypothetical protein
MERFERRREEIRRKDLVRLRDQLLERLARTSHGIGALFEVVEFDEVEKSRHFEREWLIPALSLISDCFDLVEAELPSE